MKKIVLLSFVFLSSKLSFAQHDNHKDFYSHDIGLFLGASYYIGDLNPRKHFDMSQPAGGAFYRFNYSQRFSFRGGLNFGSVRADDARSSDADQIERNLNFQSRIYELYAISEFNFVEYQLGSSKYVFSPYVFLGIDVFKFNPLGNAGGDKWIELRRLSTEGQKTSQNPTQKQYKLTQVGIPFGLGFKLNVSNNLALGLEWGPRKTFTDYLDDVSGKYVDPIKLSTQKGTIAAAMSNRTKDPVAYAGNTGKLRGNPNTKDWFFYYGITLSFKLKQKPKECRNG